MHRTITVSLASADAQILCEKAVALETVVGVSVSKNASVKPAGDVVTIHVLNKGADDVLKIVKDVSDKFSVVTSEAASFIDPEQRETIESDKDEGVWEEMETGLRHQGHVTPNFIYLMALGGAISVIGLVSEPSPQAIAFASSAIISPGFEPLAKIPLGIVLRRWSVVKHGIISSLVGYGVLILSAAIVMAILFATGSVEISELTENPEVKNISEPSLKEMIVSGAAALAGMIMIAAFRRTVIAGPLIALIIIPAAALMGAGIAARDGHLLFEGFERLALDLVFIITAGLIVFAGKQFITHRREPLI